MCTNKFLIDGLIGVHVSSIVYEVIRTISGQSIFFHENILSVKKQQNPKQTTFILLEVFVRAKTCCLDCFLLVGFGLIYVSVCRRVFYKKKINWFEIVLITSYTILLLLVIFSCYCKWISS